MIKDIGVRDIIVASLVLFVFMFTVYTTANMTLNIANRNQDAAIKNAVSVALNKAKKPDLTCKDRSIIEAVSKLAENSLHVQGFALRLNIGNASGLY